MKLPRLTAECSLGPALQSYSTAPAGALRPGPGGVTEMDFFSDLGSVFSGIFQKVPCLIGCGLPNALSIAGQCGFDVDCWIAQAPAALSSCIRQCLL
jgi:hypothetical protein